MTPFNPEANFCPVCNASWTGEAKPDNQDGTPNGHYRLLEAKEASSHTDLSTYACPACKTEWCMWTGTVVNPCHHS
jgi:hypothetical protein